MSRTKIGYTYSLFATEDGEVSTGCASDEETHIAAAWLAQVLRSDLATLFKDNPNRTITLVINSSEETNIEGKQMEKPNIERTKEELLEWGNLCLEECKSLQAHVFDLEENKE